MLRFLMGNIVLFYSQDDSHQGMNLLDQVIKLVLGYPVACEGSYIVGDECVRALLSKRALVFLDVVFLEALRMFRSLFFPKWTCALLLAQIYCYRF